MKDQLSKSGMISVIGRTNVGKSTFINKILGQKVFITSRKPQTTRNRLLGIKTKGHSQAVFIDTPGVHSGENRALNKYMNKVAFNSILGVDIVIFMLDSLKWTDQDQLILDRLPKDLSHVLLVINKVDLIDNKEHLLPHIKKLSSSYDFKEIIPVSSLHNQGLTTLENIIFSLLPDRIHDYPEDQIADVPEKFVVSELIREKCITRVGDEIPYRISVVIDSFIRKESLIDISAILYVEKDTQKGILIGHKGEKLKSVGSAARKEIEKFLESKVMLRLWVKVRKNWTNDSSLLSAFGYSDD
jgi:GTP-binding protein Era